MAASSSLPADSIAARALPAMRSELGLNYSQAGSLNTANALGYLAGALFCGWVRIKSGSIFGSWLLHASGNVAMCLSVAIRTAT
jgi:membrane protease YdiL (CAAX protease family)